MSTTTPHKQHKPLDPSILTIVEDTPPSERTTHAAQCHCGTVKFNVTLKWPFPKYPVNVCSCSICHQMGYVLVYPARRDVVFTEGMVLYYFCIYLCVFCYPVLQSPCQHGIGADIKNTYTLNTHRSSRTTKHAHPPLPLLSC